jgi:hypothetical protein
MALLWAQTNYHGGNLTHYYDLLEEETLARLRFDTAPQTRCGPECHQSNGYEVQRSPSNAERKREEMVSRGPRNTSTTTALLTCAATTVAATDAPDERSDALTTMLWSSRALAGVANAAAATWAVGLAKTASCNAAKLLCTRFSRSANASSKAATHRMGKDV